MGRTARQMVIKSIAWRTELFLISSAVQTTDCGSHIVIRSDRWPDHIWKNFLLFADLPRRSGPEAWLGLYETSFPGRAESYSVAFGWDHDRTGSIFEHRLIEAGFLIERDAVYSAADSQ